MSELLTGLGFDLASNWGIFWLCTAWTFLVVTVIWVIGIFQGNHSMMDGYYGFGYAVPVWIAYWFTGAASATAAALLAITSLHGCILVSTCRSGGTATAPRRVAISAISVL